MKMERLNAQRIEDGHRVRTWTNRVLLTGAAIFVMALFWSAVLDPTIRLLHALQSLIYVAVVVLARRNSPWGSPRPPRELPPLRGAGPRFHLRRVRFRGIRCRHTLRPQMDLCG